MLKALWRAFTESLTERLEYKSHTLFETKMAEIDTLFLTKTAKTPYPLGAAHTYKAHIREFSPFLGVTIQVRCDG